MQRIGVDLLDLWHPGSGLSPRRVLWWIEQLPETSAFAASVRGGRQFRPWTLANTLLAAEVNLLHAANQQRAGKRAKPIVKPPQQKQSKPKRVVTVAEILARRQNN